MKSVEMIRSLMPIRDLTKLKHLDIGCGDGYRIRLVKPVGEIVGIDLDENMVAQARKRGVTAYVGDAEDLHFPDESFDLVTSIEVLEHVPHPTVALAEAYRVLKRGGFFICVTPNASFLFSVIWKLWTARGLGRIWRDKHIHEYKLWGRTKSGVSLVDRLRDVGFKPEKTASTNLGMVNGVRCVKI